MCGIYSYQGSNDAAAEVLAGLKRLEYRGYDSWGIAVPVPADGTIAVHKQVGKISDIADRSSLSVPATQVAIGHTRWATHGGVTQQNAHPHAASDGSFVLAQNGVVQNYLELKKMLLAQGYTFVSETDTEVIVHLIEEERKTTASLIQAVRQAFLKLEGRNTIILMTTQGEVMAARNGSPLVVGLNHTTGDIYISSDTLSFASQVEKIVVIENGQLVRFENGRLVVEQIKDSSPVSYQEEAIGHLTQNLDKEGYDHFMLKEIHENPTVIRQVTKTPLDQLHELATVLKQARRVYTIGSGTAGIAAAQMAFYLRAHARLDATSLVGADAVEYFDLFSPEDVLIAPSQSGETADVLEVLEVAKAKGITIVTYVNMQGATMTRLADLPFLAQAGPEICVMSTKVFTSQVAWGYLVAKAVQGQTSEGIERLLAVADQIENYVNDPTVILQLQSVAQYLAAQSDIFLLGKAQCFQIIREGMVKIIEGTYRHAQALPAGDLKHYAITLMEKGVPVMVVTAHDEVEGDVLTAAQEVKARGASVIGIGPTPDPSFEQHLALPDTGETAALTALVPLQLLAYYATVKLGHDVDHPRNIAKSVTVK